MEKLVLIRSFTDNCTYCNTETEPFVYESYDKAVEDLLTLFEEGKKKHSEYKEWRYSDNSHLSIDEYKEKLNDFQLKNACVGTINFIGLDIDIDDEVPNIMTLEDWFQQNRVN